MTWGSQRLSPRMVGWEGNGNIIGLQGFTRPWTILLLRAVRLGEGSPSHHEASSHRVGGLWGCIPTTRRIWPHSQGSYSGMRGGSRHQPGGEAQGDVEVSWTRCRKRNADGWSPPGFPTTTCRTSTSAHRPACCCWHSSVSLSPWCGVSSAMRTSKCCHVPGSADIHTVSFSLLSLGAPAAQRGLGLPICRAAHHGCRLPVSHFI